MKVLPITLLAMVFLLGCKQKHPSEATSQPSSISAQANQECECNFYSEDCMSSPKEVSLKVTCPNIQNPHCHQEIETLKDESKPYRLFVACEVPPEDGDDRSMEVSCIYKVKGCHLLTQVQ